MIFATMIFATWITNLLGRILLLEKAEAIEGYNFSFGARWAQNAPAWLFFGFLAMIALAVVFYGKYHRRKPVGVRVLLGILRASALCLILLLLAEPIVSVTVTSRKRPSLWFLFDGTDSMAIADEISGKERDELVKAVGLSGEQGQPTGDVGKQLPRIEYVKALLKKKDDNLLEQLGKSFRLRAFLFDKKDGVRSLNLSPDGREDIDGEHLAGQLTTDGEVSALGEALDNLARRHATSNLAGLVIVSDFDQNSGQSPLTAAKLLGVKLYPVGIGSTTQSDLSVKLQSPSQMKKAENAKLTVILRQQGLDDESVTVSLSAKRIGGSDELEPEPFLVGERTVTLSGPTMNLDFPFRPEEAGRFVFTAKVDSLPGEVVEENNEARREETVLDDFLRLLYVTYEPTWEWRFIKEVFHRDKLVGIDGFRTFLRSSDPRVRQNDPMFLEMMAPPRSEFFKYDVIFLGDIPASALSSRFCKMTKEFVEDFGGGLVVLSGPRFGAGQLADTPLGPLLPVKIDPSKQIYDKEPFRLRLTRKAELFDFMTLGANAEESRLAWDNLGLLPWYQPVERLHPQGRALAEHPTRKCVDGTTRQPIIAFRDYGRGQVIYLGFDETWRLRRQYGEQYYRQFWGQMIGRLSLSHTLGAGKRFVVQTDRRSYRTDDRVILTVEARNAEYQKLSEQDLPDQQLKAELILPTAAAEGDVVQTLGIAELSPGVFEASFPVYAAGEYRIRVMDPITEKPVETTFQVTNVAVERQTAVRNVNLQEQIAEIIPGGKSYDLTNIAKIVEEVELTPKIEQTIRIISLWHTWICFGILVALLLAEWFLRKWVNLS